jgi:hypothetical protein
MLLKPIGRACASTDINNIKKAIPEKMAVFPLLDGMESPIRLKVYCDAITITRMHRYFNPLFTERITDAFVDGKIGCLGTVARRMLTHANLYVALAFRSKIQPARH